MNVDRLGHWDVAPRAHPNDGRVDVVEVDAAMSAARPLAGPPAAADAAPTCPTRRSASPHGRDGDVASSTRPLGAVGRRRRRVGTVPLD